MAIRRQEKKYEQTKDFNNEPNALVLMRWGTVRGEYGLKLGKASVQSLSNPSNGDITP
jgi:hypothetical protein